MQDYRADIDGLRAAAVLPVVLFHAGFTLFSGGFVGVDVFFVISGFLITGIIQRDLDAGRFSIASFYERRIRRIFPALFVVVLVCAVAAWFVLVPRDFRPFSNSVIALTVFGSNAYFWATAGYFDTGSITKPLLHTWSLSVEEQFYVVFPPLMLLLHNRARDLRTPILLSLLLASLLGCIWATAAHPEAAFYFSPFRAWELLLGAVLALGVVPAIGNRRVAEIGSAAGLGLIVLAVFVFDDNTPFPGFMAVIPCLGAALLIHCGGAVQPLVNRFLSLPPIVHIGRISYSLYLWHWPLIVFLSYYKVYPITHGEALCIVALSLALADLSWRFVETPFRARNILLTRRSVFGAAFAVMAVAISVGTLGLLLQGWQSRLMGPGTAEMLAAVRRNPEGFKCLIMGNDPDMDKACFVGMPPASARSQVWALWGDSHGAALAAMLAGKANDHGIALRFFGRAGCPPLLGVRQSSAGAEERCFESNLATAEKLRQSKVGTVILIARYPAYVYGLTSDFGPAEAKRDTLITDEARNVRSVEKRISLLRRTLTETVETLSRHGIRTVLVYPIPETGYDIPSTLLRLANRGADIAAFKRPAAYYWRRNREIFAALDAVPGADVLRVYPHEKLCDDRDCMVSVDSKPLYRDDDHLSDFGASHTAALFDPLFTAAAKEPKISRSTPTLETANP